MNRISSFYYNRFYSYRYYVKIFLDDDIYGKTTSKERRDILFWGENFTFKDLPEGNKRILFGLI
jgi:hypothetical protein